VPRKGTSRAKETLPQDWRGLERSASLFCEKNKLLSLSAASLNPKNLRHSHFFFGSAFRVLSRELEEWSPFPLLINILRNRFKSVMKKSSMPR